MTQKPLVCARDRNHDHDPSVSVCMATYNGAAFLGEQIDSIVSQLLPGDELVVADDGSTDATPEVLARYGAPLRLVARTRVGGVVANFERAMSSATGAFIVLADQDDVWMPGRLAVIRQSLEHADLVLTNARIVDASLRPLGPTLFDQLRPSASTFRNLWRNGFVGCCLGFRRELLDRVLPLPKGTPWHDWLIGLIACRVGTVRLIDAPSLLYRRHASNASPTGEVSGNAWWQKVALRWRIARALLICLARNPNRSL